VRILVTNDDGFAAPGLHALAAAMRELSDDVLIVAPLEERSGSGAAIGAIHLSQRVLFQPVEVDGLPHVPTYAVDGPPALAVLTAARGGFGAPPDLVVSGINPGLNTGRAIIHSGTVGAAMTAGNLGLPALAVSIETAGWGPSGVPGGVSAGRSPQRSNVGGDLENWSAAAGLALDAARWLVNGCEPAVLNLNVPNLPRHEIAGVRYARLATFGTVRASFAAVGEGVLELEWSETGASIDPDSDQGLVRRGFAAVTPLVGIAAAPALGSDLLAMLERTRPQRVGSP
jgi:5'-nucleotidase